MFSAIDTPAHGNTYFFTVRLKVPGSNLLIRKIGLLRNVVGLTRQTHPFAIDAAVVLPDRLHMIWTLPEGDDDYRCRWQKIKASFARHATGKPSGLWQRRFWEQPVTDAASLAFYRDAVRAAPVEAGLVRRAEDWRYSSFHQPGVVEQTLAAAS